MVEYHAFLEQRGFYRFCDSAAVEDEHMLLSFNGPFYTDMRAFYDLSAYEIESGILGTGGSGGGGGGERQCWGEARGAESGGREVGRI